MSIDPDQLRTTLQRHALDVSADDVPFARIERRARGLRRRRQALSAGGTLAVVAALAIAIPLSSGSHASKTVRPPSAGIGPSPTVPVVAGPANVLTWPTQGTVVPAQLAAAEQGFAASRSLTGTPEVKVLAAQPDGLLTQMWFPGDASAATVGWSAPDHQLELKQVLTPATTFVGLYIAGTAPHETLLVVAAPGSRIEYAPHGTSFTSVFDLPVARIDRDARTTDDAVRVGRTVRTVQQLNCGITDCG